MGYEINTTWKRMRKDDIERLNQIIDDEYSIELEIGRKLTIMKTFEELLERELEELNFDLIGKFMTYHKWEWAVYEPDCNYRVPNKSDMIKCIKEDLFKPSLFAIIEQGETHCSPSTGGFVLDMGITGESTNKDNFFLSVHFDIAHYNDELL